MSRFCVQEDGSYSKVVNINECTYKITIPESIWNESDTKKISKNVSYWIQRKRQNKHAELKYGTVKLLEDVKCHICEECKKQYNTRYGLLRHFKKYHSESSCEIVSDVVPKNIRITNIETQNQININLPLPSSQLQLRNFSDENPNWLTSDLIMRVLQHIPTAIPKLIKEKHFNDKFPENQNVRLENKRSIRKRLKVYDGGRWNIKERPEIEYGLVEQVYDILQDFIDIMTDDANHEDIDDESSPLEKRIAHITRRIRASELRSIRVRRILGDWDTFKESIQTDYEKVATPFKDKIDTFLLDNELRLEQLKEKQILLMS
jgi:hypothetical protein